MDLGNDLEQFSEMFTFYTRGSNLSHCQTFFFLLFHVGRSLKTQENRLYEIKLKGRKTLLFRSPEKNTL